MKKIIILISILVIAGLGIFFFNGSSAPVSQTSKIVDIQMTATGFTPASVSIHKGDTVKFTNTDSSPHWPASNPHPTHTDYPGFDALRPVPPGQSYSFQFEKQGRWGFHDHLDPSLGGVVTVLP